jgi:hypothetical protein
MLSHRKNFQGAVKRMQAVAALALLVSASNLLAATDLVVNDQVNNYVIPGNPPPIIDATNFDNESTFSVTYNTYQTLTTQPYEFKDVVNYTNGQNGYLLFNSPPNTNGFLISTLYGVTADFNTWRPALNNNFSAGTFFNQGTIRVDSLLDKNNLYDFGGFQFYILISLGQCNIWATNIINPGNIEVGAEGQIGLTGQNIDLTRSVLTVENTLNANQGVVGSVLLDNVNFASSGIVGFDTNGDWNPGLDLGATSALSSFFPMAPFFLDLTNSTSYFDTRVKGSTTIYRSVFVMNQNPQVPYNVYIDQPDTVSIGFEPGAAHVEWLGIITDPSTGLTTTNYLYLTDLYAFGATTNVAVVGGVPDNFSFVASSTPLLVNPVVAGFQNIFTTANISNYYSYMNGNIVATSVSTNISDTNPHGALTNLPGRVMINAGNELNLEKAIISGQDYLSLYSPNQFDGSAGARIDSPYADINLGVTNGQMTVSNVLSGSLPTWGGNIQAWSTRWVETSATATNDFRVLIVSSQLQPTAAPWVKDLNLHGATNLVLSDALNVYNSMYVDAQSLTLTTNGVGNGATSQDGELNWVGLSPLSTAQFPNLRDLTNNGAMRAANTILFTANSNSVSYGPGTPAVKATGKLSELTGANVKKGARVTIGNNQYLFVTQLTNKQPNLVKIGVNFDTSMNNLIAAVNGAAGAGTKYSKATVSNAVVRAGNLAAHAFTVTAATAGTPGNSIITWTTSTNLTWNGHVTLFGGANAIATTTNITKVPVPYDAIINNGLLSDQGTTLKANNFVSCGVISNGVGNFYSTTTSTTLTNGQIYGGNVSLAAGTMLISNVQMQALSLTIAPTNWIDAGLTNGNLWVVGTTNGTGGLGFGLTVKPPTGDLLGTVVTNFCPGPNKATLNTWAGTNLGVSVTGFSNNLALGHLILSVNGYNGRMNYTGVGVSNALYVDLLELTGSATNAIFSGNFEFTNWLNINTNLVIYYGDLLINGHDYADEVNRASIFYGKNHGRLRWVPAYTGYYSSVQYVSGGVTNLVNAGLAVSGVLDSNANGLPNASDPNPFFTPDQYNQAIGTTNTFPFVTWNSIPNAKNHIYFSTNLVSWQELTNFVSPVPYLAPTSDPKPLMYVNYNSVNPPTFYFNVWVEPDLTYPLY